MTPDTNATQKDSDTPATTKTKIAHDLLDYLEENDSVCAEGNVHGWRWIRHHNGNWQAVKYGGQHHKKSYVHGDTLNPSQVINWLTNKPVQLIPASEAHLWGPKEKTVWENAENQDVFTEANRCFWCGQSENTIPLDKYETVEHGKRYLCNDCHSSWEKADQLE